MSERTVAPPWMPSAGSAPAAEPSAPEAARSGESGRSGETGTAGTAGEAGDRAATASANRAAGSGFTASGTLDSADRLTLDAGADLASLSFAAATGMAATATLPDTREESDETDSVDVRETAGGDGAGTADRAECGTAATGVRSRLQQRVRARAQPTSHATSRTVETRHIPTAATVGALLGLCVFVMLGYALGGALSTAKPATPASAATEFPPLDCPEEFADGRYRGNGPGNTSTPIGVIAAFEHAYYVQRDAEAVVALTTGDSAISATRVHTDGIALLPERMSYCVSITAVDASTHTVELTERRPGIGDVTIRQEVDVIPYEQEFRIAAVRAL